MKEIPADVQVWAVSLGGGRNIMLPLPGVGGSMGMPMDSAVAYFDLLIRSCPPGLQGTTLMMSSSLYFIAAHFGDVLGTGLYDHFGDFTVCVIAVTVVYALILPSILLIPKKLIATADGQASAGP